MTDNLNARELLREASRSLTDARFNAMQNPLSAGQQAMVDRWAELRARIDNFLAAPDEDAMEMVRQIRDLESYGGGDYEYYLDATDAAAKIEGLRRKVPRAMLEKLLREYWPMGDEVQYAEVIRKLADVEERDQYYKEIHNDRRQG